MKVVKAYPMMFWRYLKENQPEGIVKVKEGDYNSELCFYSEYKGLLGTKTLAFSIETYSDVVSVQDKKWLGELELLAAEYELMNDKEVTLRLMYFDDWDKLRRPHDLPRSPRDDSRG